MFRLGIISSLLLGLVFLVALFEHVPVGLFVLGIVVLLILVGIYDVCQGKHAILRNFPVIGHMRYILEFIRPEIQQYFIATNQSGRPYNRKTRSLVYQRAKQVLDTLPFGTQEDINAPGFESVRHSLSPTHIKKEEARVLLGGEACTQPYSASRFNVSAMSFGSLSKNAVLALSQGAKKDHFYLNTGEGGLSPYHLSGGGDLVWQIGTAYFSCRNKNGDFDPGLFQEKAQHEQVKMIEIKLSQGAKPSHGGILPAVKITKEIAAIRGIERGKDCLSPPAHTAFDSPVGLLYFVQQLRELSGGKPIGFKLCIGRRMEFLSICKAMLETHILPDFITVDGAEGGTGAAPIEFTDHIGEPINDALIFVNNALVSTGLRHKLCVIASGKVASGMDLVTKIALGADICNGARAMMFAIGCIQALQCNQNTCPTGVATQNPRLMRGLKVTDKAQRVANFHHSTVESLLEIVGAMGKNHIDDLCAYDIYHRINHFESKNYGQIYEILQEGALLNPPYPISFAEDWQKARTDKF
ncbi:MAG: FMN-binding glutamate synthase family protein [Gammaproteobacteria bacterium]